MPTPKAKTGPKSKLTELNILELESRYRSGATTLEAIEGIMAESTYYDYLKDNEQFSERMALAREYTTEIARGVVARRIHKGDADSAKWWLERKNKREFSTRQEITGAEGKDLPTPILALPTDVRTDTSDKQAS